MQKNDDDKPVIIVKKVVKKKEGHHGGSWKIAYADFVTAMMAFFLLMWLLSMLNKFQLMGISNYYNKPSKNVYVDNEKNDTKVKKVPAEQTKKYKLVMTSKEKAPINARSRGTGTTQSEHLSEKDNIQKNSLDGEKDKKNKHEHENISQSQGNNEDLLNFKNRLENDLEENEQIRQYKGQLTFEMMEDGLKIKLQDLENQPMFSLGKVDFERYAKHILAWLSTELNQNDRKIVIIGHTDGHSYRRSHKYSNWELSADRANATRRALIKYGMRPNKIIRIQGAADSMPLDKYNSENPINRRIEIIVLTEEAAKKLLNKD